MGQKTNPNIFRLGVNKNWKTEFFEKKRHELPLYIFKTLEIKNYIKRFLEIHGIFLHDYKLQYDNTILYVYISYIVTPTFLMKKEKSKNKLLFLNKSKRKFVTNPKTNNPMDSTQFAIQKPFKNIIFNFTSLKNLYKIKSYLTYHIKKIEYLNLFIQKPKILDSKKSKTKLKHIFKVLSFFSNEKQIVTINFCCLNKNFTFLKKTQKKNFMALQKYRNTSFLKEGIEILFHVIYNCGSSHLLANFIAIQVKKVKRHRFFLSFLKQTLTVLSKSELSKVKGIKVTIKGRLNGVPRAKQKTIVIGSVPIQTIKSKIDYSQTTKHNSNGSYGVKVWIIEKN